MRALILASIITCVTTHGAWAEDNCKTKFPNIAQLEDRLTCIEQKTAQNNVRIRSVSQRDYCIYNAGANGVALRRCDEGADNIGRWNVGEKP
jgi:hypothetical protein